MCHLEQKKTDIQQNNGKNGLPATRFVHALCIKKKDYCCIHDHDHTLNYDTSNIYFLILSVYTYVIMNMSKSECKFVIPYIKIYQTYKDYSWNNDIYFHCGFSFLQDCVYTYHWAQFKPSILNLDVRKDTSVSYTLKLIRQSVSFSTTDVEKEKIIQTITVTRYNIHK